MRIHVFCSDVPPLPGKPATGGGLRSGNVIRFLRGRGHDVSFSTRRTFVSNSLTDVKLHDASAAAQIAILQENRAEAAYYCYALDCALTAQIKAAMKIKVFFDIHGPTFLEEALWMSGGNLDFFAKFARNLAIADEITVVDASQTPMVQTALAAVGTLWNPPNVAVVPLEVDVEPLERELSPEPLLLFAGAIQPWQDPTQALVVVAETLKQQGYGQMLLLGGPHKVPHRDSINVGRWLERMAATYPQFKWLPFQPRESLMRHYQQAWAMVELFRPNIERQMAFTTRTWEQLSLGLPILYGSDGVVSGLIERQQAGWVVDSTDAGQIAQAVRAICASTEEVERRGRNAVAVVEGHLAAASAAARFRHL